MKEKGFQKHLYYPATKKRFALPNAEYRYHSETETNEQVVEKAYNIANRIKRDPSVISTAGNVAAVAWKKSSPWASTKTKA